MDPMTLDTYRQRLLARQQQLVRRIFALEADLQGARSREIEYGDRMPPARLEALPMARRCMHCQEHRER